MSRIPFAAPLLIAACLTASAQDFPDLPKKVAEFTLPNGMRFLVLERRDAPSIAFRTYIGAGAANDPAGASGAAHLFERLAFTGSETIGSRDGAAEKKAIDAAAEIRGRIDAERSRGAQADEGRIASLRVELARAEGQARSLGDPGEFVRMLQDAGIVWGATVGPDSTLLEAAVPSNRAELWFLAESQRLGRPVFRNFEAEREAAAQDRRLHVDSLPAARALEALCEAAFSAHPYRQPVYGWPSDLAALRLEDARDFFSRYWVPGNITIAMVGDISADEGRRLAERYFSPIPARPLPPPILTRDPEQKGPRTVVIENSPAAILAVGYKRPDEFDRDDAALEIVRAILGVGRSGWLNRDVVDAKHAASALQIQSSYPAGRYPHLFAITASVAPGHSPAEVEREITAVLARLQSAKVDEATLDRARAAVVSGVARGFADNASIAAMLARVAGEYGDWRQFVTVLDAIRKVTADQVQAAALKYLTPSRRTSVYMETPPPVTMPARGGAR